MIALEERHRTIIHDILAHYPYTWYAFGSRQKGTNRPFSDLDLCTKNKISLAALADLNALFEESNLPFKVDLVAWERCSPEFKMLIEQDLELLYQPSTTGI